MKTLKLLPNNTGKVSVLKHCIASRFQCFIVDNLIGNSTHVYCVSGRSGACLLHQRLRNQFVV